MSAAPLLFLVLAAFALQSGCNSLSQKQEEVDLAYKACPQGDPKKLNVHLVCHTHNDVGWLKTVDQYYYGAEQDIQRAGVQYIIDSVIEALRHDPKKMFVYVETAFFWRWWNEQSDSIRHQAKTLACNGQLQFAGGGWSMNDEAATHYNSIIDQMTWGLRRLNDTFGHCGLPKVAWQIDPFGHSREQASLFAQMFFDGLFFGRLDYQDKDKRMSAKNMEELWKGSGNLGPLADLFTGVLPNSYSPPDGFCFDILCNDPPIMDDERMKNYNVKERVAEFLDIANVQSKYYATNHIIMTMGNDFNYQNAATWYKNLDKLIHYVNQEQNNGSNVNVFYSTPACYLYALNKQNHTWSTKVDDFLPYASDPHAYWTGYFTSRPSIKRYERMGNNLLQVCKQLDFLADVNDVFSLTEMREAMGIMQHHDAITGTATQQVTNDYAQTLASATAACEDVISAAYKNLSPKSTESHDQIFCNYLNVSECAITESEKPVAVTVYNPLAWNVSTYIRLPVIGQAYKIYGPDGGAVEAQLVDIPETVKRIPGRKSNATYEVVFRADLPPLGYSTYLIRNSSSKALAQEQKSVPVKNARGDWTAGNEFFTVFVDGKSGHLHRIHLANGNNLTLNQSFYWYRAMDGNNTSFDRRASGAYIFRPNGTSPISLSGNVSVSAINGSLVQEIRQVFSPWISQIIRVYKGVENIEFDWIIGPIPVEDNVGKEIITRFSTDLKTEGIFYTDSNGREMQTRLRNSRKTWKLNVTEPVSGNYYPVNSRIYIRDKSRNLQVTVLTDRSQGGSSLQDGAVELMVHRRLLHDDAFGVGQPLNESGVDGKGLVIRGSHYLLVGDIVNSASKHRPLAQKIYLQPQLSFALYNSSEETFLNGGISKWSGLNKSLPLNVHLLTLEPWKKRGLLIRLEHIYEVGEDAVLSRPVTVSLKDLFSTFKITSLNETTLGANQFVTEATRLKWSTEKENDSRFLFRSPGYQSLSLTNDLTVMLIPMRIRTFIARVER